MKRIILILLALLICLNVVGCNDQREPVTSTTTKQTTTVKKSINVNFPIDIQLDIGSTKYFRVEEDGTVLFKMNNRQGLLEGDPSKIFDEQVKINENSSKEKISTDVRDRIKELVIELTKIKTPIWAVDCSNAYIYLKDEVIWTNIIHTDKSSYKIIKEIVDLLNEHTSLEIDKRYY